MMTRRTKVPLAALVIAGLLAACGSDGTGSSGGAGADDVASVSGDDTNDRARGDDRTDTEAELLDWVECMRDEGIDLPDPTRDENGNLVIEGPGIRLGGDGQGSTSSGDEADSDEPAVDPEDMDAALEACGEPPALGPSNMSEQDRQAMEDDALEFAECMRDHGIEDFPDPDFSDMGPGGAPRQRSSDTGDDGGNGADEGPRVFLGPFGEIDMDDPDVRAAFEACQDRLGGPDLPSEPAGSGADESSQA